MPNMDFSITEFFQLIGLGFLELMAHLQSS